MMLLATAFVCTLLGSLRNHVTEYDLPNGLHVIICVDSSAPVVSTNVWYRVGAYDELPGNTGISHMLEHMTFKHSDRYKPGTFHAIVDSAGGHNNGFTSTYYTGYYEDFAKDRWELALELEAARMGSCRFDPEEFESEHGVVTEEWRLGQNRPMGRLWQEFGAVATLVHPNRNPVIGWGDDVAGYTVEKVQEWYRRHYNPANAVLVVTGDVEPEKASRLIEKHFGRLKGRPVARKDLYELEPEQSGERRITLRGEVHTPTLLLGWHNAGIRDTNAYAGDVAVGVLAHGRSSRLYRRLVAGDGPAATVWGSNSFSPDPDLFAIYVTPKSPEAIPEIERIIEEEVRKLETEPPSEHELERVKNQTLANQVFDRDDISDLGYYLASYHITEGSWRGFEEYPARIRMVTAEAVQSFTRQYLNSDNRTTAVMLPKQPPAPPRESGSTSEGGK